MNKSSHGPGGAESSCAGPDHLISGQPTAVANGKADAWTRTAQFRRAGAHGLPLKPPNFPQLNIPNILKLVCSLPASFVMAALGSTQFDRFAFPLSNPSFCNCNVLW